MYRQESVKFFQHYFKVSLLVTTSKKIFILVRDYRVMRFGIFEIIIGNIVDKSACCETQISLQMCSQYEQF